MPVSQAAFGRIIALFRERRWAEAERELIQLRSGAPSDIHLLFNLGIAQRETGRTAEARESWRQALRLDPRFLAAMVNLGALAQAAGDLPEALEMATRAVAAEPANPDLLRNLALAQGALGRDAELLATTARALRVRPGDPQILKLRLEAQCRQEHWAAALASGRELLAQPALEGRLAVLFYTIQAASRVSDWPAVAELQAPFRELAQAPDALGNPLGAAFSFDDPALLLHLARNAARDLPRHPRPARRRRDGRITVGYLSPDLREHAVSHMLLPVLRHHDRARVRVVVIDTRAGDGSRLRQRILDLAEERIDLTGVADGPALERLRAAGIDVLVDLAGTGAHGRQELLALRPCAAQLLWLGCAVTTGAEHYDGYLVDAVVAPPGHERWCSEPLVRLPCCYHPISTGLLGEDGGDGGDRGQLAGVPRSTRAAHGLPEDALVVAMFQQPDRIRPPFIEQIARTLAAEPRAHLWLRVAEDARPAVRARLAELGVAGGRVHFAWRFDQRADYLAALALADLLVDSQPYGGHSTTGEALCLGLPVLTMAGRGIHARVAASMMHELGLGDLVAADHDALLASFARLLSEPALLAGWRTRFTAAASGAAARHRRLAAALEDAYVRTLEEAPT